MLGRRVQNELRSGVAERPERRAELRGGDRVQFSEGHRKRRLELSLGGGGDGGLARQQETEAAEGAVHQMRRDQILVGVDVGRLRGQECVPSPRQIFASVGTITSLRMCSVFSVTSFLV